MEDLETTARSEGGRVKDFLSDHFACSGARVGFTTDFQGLHFSGGPHEKLPRVSARVAANEGVGLLGGKQDV